MKNGQPISYALIETALGWVGVAWNEKGLVRLHLPERDRQATVRRLLRNLVDPIETTPEGEVAATVAAIEAYCEGRVVDFSNVAVDLESVDPFRKAIYEAARRLGYGETTTYGGLAEAAGHKGLYRETGEALGANPVPIVVPCHRIIAAGGKLGGFSAPGGSFTKARLLDMEGARLTPQPAAQKSFAF